MITWFIGQPGCGKTTLAKMLHKYLQRRGNNAIHLDGDDLRVIFGNCYAPANFTVEYRMEETRKLQRMVAYLHEQVDDVTVSTVNSIRAVRDEFKKANEGAIFEVYVINSGNHVRQELANKDFEAPWGNCIEIDTNGSTPEESFDLLKVKLGIYE